MNKTQKMLIEKAKTNGFVFVDSDRAREVVAADALVEVGVLVQDKSKTVRGVGITSRCYVIAK